MNSEAQEDTLSGLSNQRAFVLLRYTLIVATAYLVLAESGFATPPLAIGVVLAAALVSNVVLSKFPQHVLAAPRVAATVIIGDTVWVTAVLLQATRLNSELLFLYSFVLLLAAIGESLRLIIIATLVVCTGYLYVLSARADLSLWSSPALMRIPFMFTVASFYAYMTERIRRARRLADTRAYTVARLERARKALVREVAQRKRALDELHASEEKYRRLVEDINDVVYSVDQGGRVTYVSPVVESLLGISPGELLGRPFSEFVFPDERNWLTSEFAKALAAQRQRFTATHRVVTKQGEVRWVRNAGRLIRENGRVIGMQGVISDVTAQRRLERQVLDIAEEEQRRIGRDLHDGLGQDLAGIGFAVRVLERNLRCKGIDDWTEARRIAELVNDGIEKTRTLARGLHPVEIGEEGLPVALRELAEATRSVFGVPCTFTCTGMPRIRNQDVATHLYRIGREAVHNAVRHGRPGQVQIAFTGAGNRVVLEVTDDGCGFPDEPPTSGLGVQIMQYRARMIGAELRIRRRAEGGTSVQCLLSTRDTEPVTEHDAGNGSSTDR